VLEIRQPKVNGAFTEEQRRCEDLMKRPRWDRDVVCFPGPIERRRLGCRPTRMTFSVSRDELLQRCNASSSRSKLSRDGLGLGGGKGFHVSGSAVSGFLSVAPDLLSCSHPTALWRGPRIKKNISAFEILRRSSEPSARRGSLLLEGRQR